MPRVNEAFPVKNKALPRRNETFPVENRTFPTENEQQLLDYSNAYIKRIENKIANVIPLVERPKVYSIAKGTVKKSAIVFVVALMISVFISSLSEGLKKSQAQVS